MIDGAVAHLGERIPCTDEVASSILVSSTNSPIAQLVEQLTVNQFVAGSSPAWAANYFAFICKIILIWHSYCITAR